MNLMGNLYGIEDLREKLASGYNMDQNFGGTNTSLIVAGSSTATETGLQVEYHAASLPRIIMRLASMTPIRVPQG
jgi:hypothetical protein